MKIRIGFEITYDFVARTPMMLMLNVHPSRTADIIKPDQLRVSPAVPFTRYLDAFGNVCTRLVAPPGQIEIRTDALVADSGLPDVVEPAARQHEVAELPHDALVFLLASRYCETERLMEAAWARFGNTPLGWARVQAICDFVHSHVRFGYQHARATKTATDVIIEDGVNGRLVDPDDEEAMAAALIDVLANTARARTLGDAARRTVAARYDIHETAERWLDAYRTVLQ
jgi:glycosyltransferase involved in cell wall biosynthesis